MEEAKPLSKIKPRGLFKTHLGGKKIYVKQHYDWPTKSYSCSLIHNMRESLIPRSKKVFEIKGKS